MYSFVGEVVVQAEVRALLAEQCRVVPLALEGEHLAPVGEVLARALLLGTRGGAYQSRVELVLELHASLFHLHNSLRKISLTRARVEVLTCAPLLGKRGSA